MCEGLSCDGVLLQIFFEEGIEGVALLLYVV